MELMDKEAEKRIEESFYEERERIRRNTNLPKKSLDHTLLRTKKFFGGESGQKESPKFSPAAEEEHRKGERSEPAAVEPEVIELAPRTRPHRQMEEPMQERRYRSRFSIDSNNSNPKTVQFSPYKRPTSRRPRLSYLGKENYGPINPLELNQETSKSNLNVTMQVERSVVAALQLQNKQLRAREQVYKSEVRTLTDQLARERSTLSNLRQSSQDRQGKQQQLKELTAKIDQLRQQNKKLSEESATLRCQYDQLQSKDNQLQRLSSIINKQLKVPSKQPTQTLEILQQMLKKHRRMESFVESIVDMRAKIVGGRDQNLKELWRWLKKTVQEINSINDFMNTLKEELRLPKQAKFEDLKTKLIKRLLAC